MEVNSRQAEKAKFNYFCELSRNALVMTDAELKLIASAAIIGDNNKPVIG